MSKEVTIYHNPRCSNSRGALAILRDRGIEPRVIEYLKTPLGTDDLRRLADLLALAAHDVLRTKESEYGDLNLSPSTPDQDIFDAIATHPILLQRPIVVCGDKAVIARPPEMLTEII